MKISVIIFSFFCLIMIIGCNDVADKSGNGTLTLYVTDAPYPIEFIKETNITINKIEAVPLGDEVGQITLSENEYNLDLMELNNGIKETLLEVALPEGGYKMIRMYITSAKIILIDDSEFDLTIPSDAQSGLKILISPNLYVAGGLSSELLLDFDISRSFLVLGNSDTPEEIEGFYFRPVIRVVNLSYSGSISGNVRDTLENPVQNSTISLFCADTLFTTTFSNNSGEYKLIGIPSGEYVIICEKDSFELQGFQNIEVYSGNETIQDFTLIKE